MSERAREKVKEKELRLRESMSESEIVREKE